MEEFEDENTEETEQSSSSDGKKKRLFMKELRCMLYGFGDDEVSYTETVEVLADLLMQFITDMTLKAMQVGKKGKVHVEDIVYLIRKDPKKYARVKELLTMNEVLKKERKAFDAESYAE